MAQKVTEWGGDKEDFFAKLDIPEKAALKLNKEKSAQ
jgi:hypothetical protein